MVTRMEMRYAQSLLEHTIAHGKYCASPSKASRRGSLYGDKWLYILSCKICHQEVAILEDAVTEKGNLNNAIWKAQTIPHKQGCLAESAIITLTMAENEGVQDE